MNSLCLSILLITISTGFASDPCSQGYWGEDCMNVCGQCFVKDGDPVSCAKEDGKCERGCLGGYYGSNCNISSCPGGCGSGECLAPNYCGNCGDINKVSPNCEDIRLRGLLGSLMAFIVIIASISLCGFGSVYYKRKKNVSVNL